MHEPIKRRNIHGKGNYLIQSLQGSSLLFCMYEGIKRLEMVNPLDNLDKQFNLRSWRNGRRASLRNWYPQDVRVRVSPTALSSSNRKSYFARNGFSFDFGSNYAVQIRLFTLLIFSTLCSCGGIGRHDRLKICCPLRAWGFESLQEYKNESEWCTTIL